MTTLAIKDLAVSTEMDRKAMTGVIGGLGDLNLGNTNTDVQSMVANILATIDTPVNQSNTIGQVSNVGGAVGGDGVNTSNGNNFAIGINFSEIDSENYPYIDGYFS